MLYINVLINTFFSLISTQKRNIEIKTIAIAVLLKVRNRGINRIKKIVNRFNAKAINDTKHNQYPTANGSDVKETSLREKYPPISENRVPGITNRLTFA